MTVSLESVCKWCHWDIVFCEERQEFITHDSRAFTDCDESPSGLHEATHPSQLPPLQPWQQKPSVISLHDETGDGGDAQWASTHTSSVAEIAVLS